MNPRHQARIASFCDVLYAAGKSPGSGVRWPPFVARADVIAELAKRDWILCEDGANHDPKLRRFFATEANP